MIPPTSCGNRLVYARPPRFKSVMKYKTLRLKEAGASGEKVPVTTKNDVVYFIILLDETPGLHFLRYRTTSLYLLVSRNV